MAAIGDAFFVERPRTIADLKVPHPIEKRKPVEIVKIISLASIDYENFIYDMLADREFIEVNSHLCSRGDIWKGLFICRKKADEGVIVIPKDKCYVGWAAFYSL